MNRKLIALGIAGALAGAMPAWAYQPLVTDDTGTQGEGGNQIEVAWSGARDDDGAGTLTRTATYPLTFTRGVTDGLDVYIAASHVRTDDGTTTATGTGNTAIGLKWRFHEEDKGWSFGIKPELQFGSAAAETKGIGNGKNSWGVLLIATRETGFGEFHVNLSQARVNVNDAANTDRKNLMRLSMAPVWQASETIKLALDLGVQTNPDANRARNMQYAMLGMVYSPSDDLDFAVGAKRQSGDGPNRASELTAGLTWRFK